MVAVKHKGGPGPGPGKHHLVGAGKSHARNPAQKPNPNNKWNQKHFSRFDGPPRIIWGMGGRLNKMVALNFISVFLFSLSYRSNQVIALGFSSVFLFALGVLFRRQLEEAWRCTLTLVHRALSSSGG